jgi:hypothetical protein
MALTILDGRAHAWRIVQVYPAVEAMIRWEAAVEDRDR